MRKLLRAALLGLVSDSRVMLTQCTLLAESMRNVTEVLPQWIQLTNERKRFDLLADNALNVVAYYLQTHPHQSWKEYREGCVAMLTKRLKCNKRLADELVVFHLTKMIPSKSPRYLADLKELESMQEASPDRERMI